MTGNANQSSAQENISRIRGSRLREKPRPRATAAASAAEPERAELDLAVVEAEEGSVREVAISARRVFVASTVNPEIAIMQESLRMRQKHASYFECAKSKLIGCEDLACPADTATPVAKTKLTGND